MLHVCVRRFDLTGTVQKNLGTKQSLNALEMSYYICGRSGQVLFHLGAVCHEQKMLARVRD